MRQKKQLGHSHQEKISLPLELLCRTLSSRTLRYFKTKKAQSNRRNRKVLPVVQEVHEIEQGTLPGQNEERKQQEKQDKKKE